jgi:hypothetical protein
MALTTTTLSSAVVVTDNTIAVTSATGFAAGNMIIVDQEVMKVVQTYVSGTTIGVIRGQNGTVTAAHPTSANITTGLGSDFADASAMTTNTYPTVKARTIVSYSTSGAIALPAAGSDTVAVLNGTSTLTMTLALPTKDMDGTMLWIFSNGKGAHTVNVTTAGLGNGGTTMDVGTYNTTEATGCALMALNGFWLLWANGIASSGTQLAGVVWA